DVTELAMGTREKKYALLTDGDGNAVMPATEADNVLVKDGKTVQYHLDKFANIDASKITSGVFDAERIPNLHTSKITSGVFDAERIPHNKILYEGDHDFKVDGDFETSEYDFSFEDGSTYALEIHLFWGIVTAIFTFAPVLEDTTVSYVACCGISTTSALLDVGVLRVYANRIKEGLAGRISFTFSNDDINNNELTYLRLKRVIKLR
ncbi:MAG TPA: hypothetical protein GX745_09095, partial [Clostridiales bacterium]|nr:hypothetical protein [Clostridiales bacterium]